jgi:acyl-coenzyme A thioesterase PaaI-like protein
MAWTFGETPLSDTVELAAVLRRLLGVALSMEASTDELRDLIAQLEQAELALAAAGPASPAPRVGGEADADGRVYLDHSRDIGAFNPVFPLYEIEVDGDRATGTVEFPITYEGPPGIVHGGFIAVLFDAVVQHHNCDVGVAGKTTKLGVSFRRPTPLLTSLTFDIERTTSADRIESRARLLRGDKVCAEATVHAIAGDHAALPAVSPRRSAP